MESEIILLASKWVIVS